VETTGNFVHLVLEYSATVLPDGEMRHQILKIPLNLKRLGDKKRSLDLDENLVKFYIIFQCKEKDFQTKTS